MIDVIYRQEAIDTVMHFMPSLTTPDGYGSSDQEIYAAQEMFVDIGQALNNLPSAQPHWILCNGRPPEEGEEVFVYLFQNSCPYIAWIDDGRWYTEYFELDEEDYPVAWMPLPQPYKK